ncbi:MAG: hypothetical protein AAGI15_16845, partial [Pseudomonadota bacterium]
ARLRSQADRSLGSGGALPEPLERLIRSFLEPFALIPREDLAQLERQLSAAEQRLMDLSARLASLEAAASMEAEAAAKAEKKKRKGKGKKRKDTSAGG